MPVVAKVNAIDTTRRSPHARDVATPETPFDRAVALCARATDLCAASRSIERSICRQRAARPLRRLHWLARGANDDVIETDHLRCPHCEGERVRPLGRVVAAEGRLKISHECEACAKPFVFVRPTRDFFGGPDPRHTP